MIAQDDGSGALRDAEPGGDTSSSGFVYIIGAVTPRGPRTYVGWTLDPGRRLAQHNAGTGAKSTRGHLWQILYLERHESRSAAMSREWHLKRDRRFRKLLAEDLDQVCGPGRIDPPCI